MKKLKPLFGFECSSDEEGLVIIEGICNYPQESNSCMLLYNRLEESKILDSNIEFPTRIIHWTETISATDKFTLMNYFRIDGIKKIVEENKSKLIGKTTFIKPEVNFLNKRKYPNLNIHFYQVSEEAGMEVMDIEDMIESCLIHYNNIKQFTPKRLADLEPFVNPSELQIMSFLPMELVKFSENGDEILEFPQHLLAKKTVELPF